MYVAKSSDYYDFMESNIDQVPVFLVGMPSGTERV